MSRILTSRGTININIPPGAKTNADGEYYMICPICASGRLPEHQTQKLLAINLKKPDLPWRCNHCGEAGYIVEELAISQMNIKPVAREFQFNPIPEAMQQWFWNERRIGKETLDHFKISMSQEMMMIQKAPEDHIEWKGKWINRACINFKYFRNDILINVKFRDKQKNFKLVSGASLILFNIDSIKNSKECLIVEGEPDCMAYYEAGYKTVVSVPNGATVTKEEKENYETTGIMTIRSLANMEYIDLCWEDLEHIEHFIIGTDDDAAGIKLRQELARRLGFEKCSYIKYSEWFKTDKTPCKDGNEVLYHNDRNALLSTLSITYDFPIEGVNTADKYLDVLMKNFKNGRERGLPTGYFSMEAFFNWMRGWLTVINGYPTMGKTTFLLNLIAITTVLYEWKWGLYSPENYPVENIIDTLAEIFVGKSSDIEFHGRMTEEEYRKVIVEHIKKYIYFVDREEGYSPEDLREIKKQMIKRYGIVGFLTDPWSTLNHPNVANIDRYLETQLNAETRLATKYSIVNLIAHHPPTPKDKSKVGPPTSFDLIGGQIWFNKAFALLSIHKQSSNIDDLLVDIFVQKIKEHKLAGHPTDSTHYITLKYERRTNRFLERHNITDETSPFDTFPIKNFSEYYQSKLDGF